MTKPPKGPVSRTLCVGVCEPASWYLTTNRRRATPPVVLDPAGRSTAKFWTTFREQRHTRPANGPEFRPLARKARSHLYPSSHVDATDSRSNNDHVKQANQRIGIYQVPESSKCGPYPPDEFSPWTAHNMLNSRRTHPVDQIGEGHATCPKDEGIGRPPAPSGWRQYPSPQRRMYWTTTCTVRVKTISLTQRKSMDRILNRTRIPSLRGNHFPGIRCQLTNGTTV
jgi:hypothetical protein